MAFEIRKEIFVGNCGRLNDLGKPAPYLFLRESPEQVIVAEDESGLAEGSDHVFITPETQPIFPTQGGIHLGEESRGDEPEIQAAHEGRGDKPGYIADDPAADSDDEPISVHPLFDELLVKQGRNLKRLT